MLDRLLTKENAQRAAAAVVSLALIAATNGVSTQAAAIRQDGLEERPGQREQRERVERIERRVRRVLRLARAERRETRCERLARLEPLDLHDDLMPLMPGGDAWK